MKSALRLILLLVLSTSLLAAGHNIQRNMHGALNSLRAAKTSAHPQEDLKDAIRRLGAASHDKGGYRVEAIRLARRAITEFAAGHRIPADKLLDSAIDKVEKGIAVGVN